jgi:hypothetical protein
MLEPLLQWEQRVFRPSRMIEVRWRETLKFFVPRTSIQVRLFKKHVFQQQAVKGNN